MPRRRLRWCEMLEARVAAVDPEAARWVHLGATSQDVFDTALILCIRAAWASIERDHMRLSRRARTPGTRHMRVA